MRWYDFKDDGKLDSVAAGVAAAQESECNVVVKLLYWYFRSILGAANDDMAIHLSRGESGGWVDYTVYVPLPDLKVFASPAAPTDST